MSSDLKKDKSYTDASIQVLEGMEAVRARPGMYIGSTDSIGLHHLIWEILDNSVDEMQAGYADKIILTIKPNHVISISDNGRGIPTGINAKTKQSNLLVVFTVLHAGGKFDNSSYKTSGGLHGVGSTCVNALSDFFHVVVYRDGKQHEAKFKNGGNIDQHPTIVGDVDEDKTGTVITWRPDFTIFDKVDYDLVQIEERLRTLAFLNKGKIIEFRNEIDGINKTFCFEKGLEDWINLLNSERNTVSPVINYSESGEVKDRRKVNQMNKIEIDFSFQYCEDDRSSIFSFCNNISTSQGGTHLESFKDGLLDCIRVRAVENKIVKFGDDIEKSDVVSALTAVVSVKYSNPEYSGQTKGILSNTEIKRWIRSVTETCFNQWMEENQDYMKNVLERVKQSRNLRLRIEETKKAHKTIAKDGFLFCADKLADCTLKDSDVSELYIVEGDSAGGSAKGARDRDYQAILPIKGKLINVWRMKNRSKCFENSEIKSLISAIGCGYEYGNSHFDVSKLMYNKIIIMTDADVDGSHIRTLILTFIYKFMRELIEKGYVYVAQPPLYKASTARGEVRYFKEEEDKDAFLREGKRGWDISRFKGLGEMSPIQLRETTMNPSKRTLVRVTPEKFDENNNYKDTQDIVFNDLMGDDVAPRRQFIMKNYHKAKMLDV